MKNLCQTTNWKIITLTALLVVAIRSHASELKIVLDDNEVLNVEESSTVVQKAVQYTTKHIASLQETISFNNNFENGVGLKLSNSRLLFPMGDGNFIVTEKTALAADFISPLIQKNLNDLQIGLNVQVATTPTIRRFFVAAATDEKSRSEYKSLTGPKNTSVKYGVDDNLYEITAGVKVDKVRFARYKNWSDRFTKNISRFPLTVDGADKMLVGEGFALAFDGVLALGPSAYFSLPNPISLSANFSFSKVLRAGRFELIVYKSTKNNLLFSIRQSRQTLNNEDYRLSYGGGVSIGSDLILGSKAAESIFKVPTSLDVISVKAERELKHESRFNSVYELDLTNNGERELYNNALSKFDFSLFDVFTLKNMSTNSKILKKFRDANIKLVLNSSEKARVMTKNFKTNIGFVHKRAFPRRHEFVTGTSQFNDKTVETLSGSAGYSKTQSSFFWGYETDLFEIVAYEEYGAEANPKPDDVIILARKIIFDDETENTSFKKGSSAPNEELQKYLKEFNYFSKDTINITAGSSEKLGTTQGRMDFFITRSDIASLSTLDTQEVKQLALEMFKDVIDERYKKELMETSPKNWSFNMFQELFLGDSLNSMKNFVVGFQHLKTALSENNTRMAARALTKMISKSQHAQKYARLLKSMIELTGRSPLININISNSRTQLNYSEKAFSESHFIRDGLILSQKMANILAGQAYYEDLRSLYPWTPVINQNNVIEFNFHQTFNGFIKLHAKEQLAKGDAYKSLGELIIDLSSLKSRRFSFDIENGNSPAEKLMRSILSSAEGNVQIYFSISHDDRLYDRGILLEKEQ